MDRAELRDLVQSILKASDDTTVLDASDEVERRREEEPDEFYVDLCSLVKDDTASVEVYLYSSVCFTYHIIA